MRYQKPTEFITTADVAECLGYTQQHTRLLIRKGRLQAHKFGRDWMVLRESVTEYKTALLWPDARPAKATAPIVNVASVPLRSPFRYPGGKTWLVPRIRQWLKSMPRKTTELFEPFAGGAIVGLTAIFDGLANHVTLVELDPDVASVWQTILSDDANWLTKRILDFKLSHKNIQEALEQSRRSTRNRALATILRNRVNRGGILAPGAGIVKNGENGKGLLSRWYPETLCRRILAIAALRRKISFIQGDGLRTIAENVKRCHVSFFIDPPYTAAGRRLYRHSELDHEKLFDAVEKVAGNFLMTYDDSPDIRRLARNRGFQVREVLMKNTHHAHKIELLIGKDLEWCKD